jgi:hypothetical protein
MCLAFFGILGWATAGAIVGALAAGLYGALFGLLDGLIHGDLSRLGLAGLGFFGLCGGAAGALTGGFARMIDPEGIADLTSGSHETPRRNRVVYFTPDCPADPLMAQQWLIEGSLFERESRIKPSLN